MSESFGPKIPVARYMANVASLPRVSEWMWRRGSFPEAEHGVDVPEQVPHLVHQRLHLLVLLAHFLGDGRPTHKVSVNGAHNEDSSHCKLI